MTITTTTPTPSARGVCVLAPQLWTPIRKPRAGQLGELALLCRNCPARRSCAADAVRDAAGHGVYAGVWVPERRMDNAGWLQAMAQLRAIAGLPAESPEALGVPA